MDTETQRQAIAAMESATAERPAVLVGDTWDEVFAGNVTFTVAGWTVAIFNDCGGWDYIDEITAPDGRRFDYDEMPDVVRFWQPSNVAGWPSVPVRGS